MYSPRLIKVCRDLLGNKTRTILVVLSIAVGAFAVGAILSSMEVLREQMDAAYMKTDPASAVLYTWGVDDDLVAMVQRIDGIKAAEGRRRATVKVKAGEGKWTQLDLYSVPDYEDIRMDKVAPQAGAWPPPKKTVLIERAGLKGRIGLEKFKIGDNLLVEAPGGRQRELKFSGTVHDINQASPMFSGRGCGYVTAQTMEWLGFSADFNELHITVSEHADDKKHIEKVAQAVKAKVEKSGRSVGYVYIADPGKHPASSIVEAFTAILGTLGALSLFLSGFLVVNTISALMSQQTKQLGIMKAIGGTSGQIASLYLGMVIIFGLLSMVVSLPLTLLATRGFALWTSNLLNFDLVNFKVPAKGLLLQAAVGILVPILSALWPVLSGIRVTVREAISSTGISDDKAKEGFIDKALMKIRGLSRPVLLSMRNTFRRKGRLILTLITLSLGGAVFIAVFSVQSSLYMTLEDAFDYWNYDVSLSFSNSYRTERILDETLKVPGVVKAECWNFGSMIRLRNDGTEGNRFSCVALPSQTQLIKPAILRGRWLLPEDENALVINTDVKKKEPDLDVGSKVRVKINEKEYEWTIVGVVRGVLTGSIAYANYPYYSSITDQVGRASSVNVVTKLHDAQYENNAANALEAHFKNVGLNVSSRDQTTADTKAMIKGQFNLIIYLLMFMAVLLSIVGGLGLSSTMSMNVLERTREIGVMRAIGASDGSVIQVFLFEGLVIGVTSWILGTFAAFPISRLLSDTVGDKFLQAPLSYTFSWDGALLWLAVSCCLAALASLMPARKASRITVREVLAYEG